MPGVLAMRIFCHWLPFSEATNCRYRGGKSVNAFFNTERVVAIPITVVSAGAVNCGDYWYPVNNMFQLKRIAACSNFFDK
ncbi:hypothetical protein O9929_25435 [Vibrio lentus]|nr:hypothetical protein [Vibrio lentus]